MKLVSHLSKKLLVLAFWLFVWQLAALLVGRELLLPGPMPVLRRLLALAREGSFWLAVGISMLRILAGAFAGCILGTLLAALTSRFSLLRALLSPVLTTIKSTPVASFIILALIWMGRDLLPSFIAALMVTPLVWTNVSAGISGTDSDLLEAARVFGFSRAKLVLHVYLPSTAPYFVSACRAALGLAWKAGVAAEVLTLPKGAIGTRLFEAKLYLETTDLFAWTLVIILCSLVIEQVLMALIGSLGSRFRAPGEKS